MNEDNKDLILLLKEEIQLMDKAADILNYSYDTCSKIGIKEEYSYDELDRFESFDAFLRVFRCKIYPGATSLLN
jgi:hypothetical protein